LKWYKIFDEKEGNPRTLFHGVNGSKTLPLNEWIEAVVKDVSDGGTVYKSGFHILSNLQEIRKYATRFKESKIISEVDVDEDAGIWPKIHSPSKIMLAKKMRICTKQWNKMEKT
jgi:hypothetical protein